MKNIAHKRAWLIGIWVFISIIIFRHVWVWLPEHRYTSLVSHQDVVNALNVGDTSKVVSLSHTYHYSYQVFKSGKLVSSSGNNLPNIHLLAQPQQQRGVLKSNLNENLAHTTPYQTQIALFRYVFFASTPVTNSKLVYVIYDRVI